MKRYAYLILELVWFLPVIIAQWVFAPQIISLRWKAIPMIAIPMSIYLAIIDKVALREGIWAISKKSSTGMKIAGVPIEEVIFFLLTSWVSAQGVILLSNERSPTASRQVKMRHQTRLVPSRIRH